MKRKNILIVVIFTLVFIISGFIIIKANLNSQNKGLEQEDTNQSDVLWEKEYQSNKIELVNNMYESYSITVNDKEVFAEEIGVHNGLKEIYCQEGKSSLNCLLNFVTTSGYSYFNYFSIGADGQLLEQRAYQANGYHHSGQYTTEGLFTFVDDKLYIVNISDSFPSSQVELATTNLEISILDDNLNLIENFSFEVENSLRISSCSSTALHLYDPNNYLETRDDITIEDDAINLTCILTDYEGNESLYDLNIDVLNQTYSVIKQGV